MTRPPIPEGWEFRLSHDRRLFAFYDPGNGPWFVPEPAMRGRFVDSAEMNSWDWYRYVPELEQLPTDRATLRDAIRRAVCEAEGFAWDSDMLEPDEYGEVADAVLAVLPEPADRAAVLRETAQGYRGLVHDVEQPEIKTRYAQTADELDRLADDAQLAAPHLAAVLAAVLAECDTIEADYEGQHDEVGVGARAAILRIRTRATATDHTSESTAEEAPPAFEDDLQRAATVDPAVCPRCKGDNSEAFELCERCAPAVGGAQQADRIVAYRSPGGHYLYCPLHADRASWTPVTAEDLRDGGICTVCYVDVLIEQQPKEA